MRTQAVEGHVYAVKTDHRDRTPIKSQWTIPERNEIQSFGKAVRENWILDDLAWGLHVVDGRAEYLGLAATNPGPPTQLFFALFEFGDICHGFPADHLRSSREIPPTAVQRAWLDGQYVRPQVVKKIAGGKRCRL